MTNPTTITASQALAERDSFLADREAWVAAGRPADMSFAHWAGVVSAAADREAEARGYVAPPAAAPLVVFG